MIKYIFSISSLLIILNCSQAQTNRVADSIQRKHYFDSIGRLSSEDHEKMMHLLHINSIRPGPSGNPSAPNAANTDETKASPYTSLPDPLLLNNGEKVTDAKTWWNKRRPEIVEYFDREIYGRVPANVPTVKWQVISTTKEKNGEYDVITKKLSGHVDNSSYPAIQVEID